MVDKILENNGCDFCDEDQSYGDFETIRRFQYFRIFNVLGIPR